MSRLDNLEGRTFTRLVLALLAAGIAVAYGGGLGVGFYFDDGYGIRDNPAIRSLANVPSFFTDPFTLTTVRENVDIRPVLVTTYAINYAISGVQPWSYHLFNMVVHFLTAAMVFVLVRDHLWWPEEHRGRRGDARLPAAAAALFFALAPINNQALNYMWARSALLCTFFYVGAFLAMMDRRAGLAVVLHVLALFTKAIALTLPAVIVIYDYLYRDIRRHPDLRSWLADWKELVPPVGPLVVANVLYLVWRWWMLPPWASDYLHEKWVTPWIWCMSQWPALLWYVKMFAWPTGLSVDHDFPYVMTLADPRAIGALVGILAWLAAALLVSRRRPHVAFATLWFFVTLAPESTFAALAEVVNDHRPYIASSLGLSVLSAWVLEKATNWTGSRRRDVYAAAVAVLCVAAVTAGYRRTAQWAAEDTLWDATVQTSPNNGRAWMNSGLVEMRKGNLEEARRRFEKARQLVPVYPYLYMNLSALELAEGNVKAGVDNARQAVRFGPDLSRSHYYLGVALERQRSMAEALAEYRRACEIDAKDSVACAARDRVSGEKASSDSATSQAAMMGEGLRLLDEEHEAARAVDQFRALLAKNPDHYGATYQLARALDAAGRRDEATQVWQRMLSMAQAAGDKDTEERVRARLAAPTP